MWQNTTGKRLFWTEDGKVVDEDDPKALGLLVGIDGSIPLDLAEKYGLSGEKAKKETPDNKAKAPPDDPKAKPKA